MTNYYGCYDEITAEFEIAVLQHSVENKETYYSELSAQNAQRVLQGV